VKIDEVSEPAARGGGASSGVSQEHRRSGFIIAAHVNCEAELRPRGHLVGATFALHLPVYLEHLLHTCRPYWMAE
jgi:hypothetical protein